MSFNKGCNSSTTDGKCVRWSEFVLLITLIISGEKLPSGFTDARNEKILPWIKHHINKTSVQTCRKSKNYHDPQIEFRYLSNERQEMTWVDERARYGHLVSVVSVTDQDIWDRGRSAVTIIAGNEEGQFSLDSYYDYSGRYEPIHLLRVAGRGQLNRETTSQYQLTVQAEDWGPPSRTSTATLTVNIGGEGRFRSIFVYHKPLVLLSANLYLHVHCTMYM